MNPKSRIRAPKSFRNGVKAFVSVFNANKYGVHLRLIYALKPYRKANKYSFNVIYNDERIGIIYLSGFSNKCEISAYDVKIKSIYRQLYLYKKGMPKFRFLGSFLRSRILKAQGAMITDEIMES